MPRRTPHRRRPHVARPPSSTGVAALYPSIDMDDGVSNTPRPTTRPPSNKPTPSQRSPRRIRVNGARAVSESTEPAPYPSQRSPRRIRVNGARAESGSTEPAPNPGQRNGTATNRARRPRAISLSRVRGPRRAGPAVASRRPLPVDGRARQIVIASDRQRRRPPPRTRIAGSGRGQ